MPKINILDKHTAELIAAGEVVERPASAIKEMVENSIDAGATTVTVEIMNGGISYIRVADNGCGISRDDVKRAFIRHATSKISCENDLAAISTLGFRGEALASISSVAKVDLLTCAKGEEFGTRYVIEGGEEKLLDDAGCPTGSTLIVRDLFYNTPARMKFLKKNTSESNAVADVLDRMALSHPEVSIRFIRDGKECLLTPGDGKLYSAVYSVYGKDFAKGLIPVVGENGGISVTGFISKPLFSRASRSMQLFFLNGRFVKTGTGMAALNEAYKGSIMVGKFPACVLQIKYPFDAVDVNVHPAKTEVRFANEKPVFDAVYYSVKAALVKGDTRPEAVLKDDISTLKPQNKPFEKSGGFYNAKVSEIKPVQVNFDSMQQKVEFKSASNLYKCEYQPKINIDIAVDDCTPESKKEIIPAPEKPQAEFNDTEDTVQEEAMPQKAEIETDAAADNNEAADLTAINSDPQPRLIGEAFETYIIVEVGKKLLLIDKHAAHERILYNKLISAKKDDSAQMLLTPITLAMRKTEYTALLDNREMLENAGIIIDDFGQGSVIVRSVPMCLDGENPEELIEEIAANLTNGQKSFSTGQLDWLYHSIACRAAVKSGDKSTNEELMVLVRQIINDDSIRYCPHGRPVAIWLTEKELEKQFGRV